MVPLKIIEETLNKELKEQIHEGFREHALTTVDSHGNIRHVTLTVRENDHLVGALYGKTFWGGLHIKNLYVISKMRGQGIGSGLLQYACDWGFKQGCRFAFVETLNFQGVDFYKSHGFIEEYVRIGYDKGVSFHYLRKDF